MGDDHSFNQKEFFHKKNTQSPHNDPDPTGVPYGCTSILRNGTQLEIRKAAKSDYGSVLSLGVQYSGNDYLPALYHPLLDSGAAHMFLACIGGKAVGFRAALLTENRTRAVLFALRCKEGYRNLGIGTQLSKVTELYLKQNQPKCLRFMRVKSSSHPQESSKYGSPIAVWRNTYQKYTPLRFKQLLHHLATDSRTKQSVYSVSQLTTPEALQLLKPNGIEDIFGYNKWFPMSHIYMPYRVSDPAFRGILDNSLILCSGVLRNSSKNQSCFKLDQITLSDVAPKAISFSSVLEVPCGVLFDVYYHGDCTLDSIKSHLRHILERCMITNEYLTNTKDVALVINLPVSVDRESIDNLLRNYCFENAWECPHVFDDPL